MINPINHREFHDKFMSSARGSRIRSEYDVVYCEPNLVDYYKRTGHNVMGVAQWEQYSTTPREISGNRSLTTLHRRSTVQTSFSITPFYYLQYLEDVNPSVIADIGCGWNVFKQYIPSIVGWDQYGSYADHSERYDAAFRAKYFESFDCAFSINAVSALTWDHIAVSIKDFMTIVKKRAFLSFPALWLYHNTPYEWYERNGLTLDNPSGINAYVLDSIKALGFEVLVYDSNIKLTDAIVSHDGDIRVVLSK